MHLPRSALVSFTNFLPRSLVNLCSASEQAATKCVNDIVDGEPFQSFRLEFILKACRPGLCVCDFGLRSSCCLWASKRDLPVRREWCEHGSGTFPRSFRYTEAVARRLCESLGASPFAVEFLIADFLQHV
jgi:hypothetical protein